MRRAVVLIAAALVWSLALVVAAQPSVPLANPTLAAARVEPPPLEPAPPVMTPEQAQAAGYVGQDTCITCHSDKEGTLKGTEHGQAKNPRAPAAIHGCESCHGPGKAHVDDDAKGHIKKFNKEMKPAEVNETCLACHNRGAHAGWEGSTHAARNLMCTTCHSVHSPK